MPRRPPVHDPQRKALDFEAAERLAAIVWKDGFACAKCGSRKAHHLKSRPRVWQCAQCDKQRSVTAGTTLQDTKVALVVWEQASELLQTDDGVSALQASAHLSVRYHTVWQILHRLRAGLPSGELPQEPDPAGPRPAGSGWIPLTRVGEKATGSAFLNWVEVVTCDDDGGAAPRFGLPVGNALWTLARWRPWRTGSPPMTPTGLVAAMPPLLDRLRSGIHHLRAWLGRLHGTSSTRWFANYVRFYREYVWRRPASPGGLLAGALASPRSRWRSFRPPVPDVLTCGRMAGQAPGWPPTA